MTMIQTNRESTLTCPTCGCCSHERMPLDARLYSYECRGCGRLLKPRRGDCCVFCAYGDVPCPPTQAAAQIAHAAAPP